MRGVDEIGRIIREPMACLENMGESTIYVEGLIMAHPFYLKCEDRIFSLKNMFIALPGQVGEEHAFWRFGTCQEIKHGSCQYRGHVSSPQTLKPHMVHKLLIHSL